MLPVAVIDDPAIAEISLDRTRGRLLRELAEPASATALSTRVGLPRQLVNYHLKTLEQHGLVHLVEERRRGNMTERVMQASAASYVISPLALSGVQPDPDESPDRLSARWLLAVAARLLSEVGALVSGAERARKPLATFGLDAEVRFATARERSQFAEDLADCVATLVAKYHDDKAAGGRAHRVVVALHPVTPTAAQGSDTAGSKKARASDHRQAPKEATT